MGREIRESDGVKLRLEYNRVLCASNEAQPLWDGEWYALRISGSEAC